MFPSSRYTMDRTFEIEVYTRLSQRLLGEELCPASIDLLSNQYFPDNNGSNNNGIKKKDIFELTASSTADSLFQQKPVYLYIIYICLLFCFLLSLSYSFIPHIICV